MNNKNKKILEKIFDKPDRNDIEWEDFINMLLSLGATIRQQGGSAHGIKLNGEYAVFHRPHPEHTIYKSDLKRIRRFLLNAGVDKVE